MGEVTRGPLPLAPVDGATLSSPLPPAGGAGGGPSSQEQGPTPAPSRKWEGNRRIEPRPFWEAPIETLDRGQWEALCDGCGKCCLHKLEDDDTGDFYETNVACTLLDLTTARCKDYPKRRAVVPDCVQLTANLAHTLGWLPASCAYRLRADGQPLPDWHYLVSGDRDAVHRAGASVVGKAISEDIAGPLEQHIVWPHGEGYAYEVGDEDEETDDA